MYADHLNNLTDDSESRFNNVLTIEICDLAINAFSANVNKADIACQEELLEIGYDEESKTNFVSGSYMQPRQIRRCKIYIKTCGKCFLSC